MLKTILKIIFYLIVLTFYITPSLTFASSYNFSRAIDSSTQVTDQNRIHYAYGPSITYDNGTYHMIYCSNGHPNGYPNSWDYLRYSKSADGLTWQPPEIVLTGQATNNQSDLAACLGSVVYYNNHYYLFYESARRIPNTPIDPNNPTHGTQTVIQVARANQISGPYYVYNQRGNWDEINPPDPKPIIIPLNPTKGGPTNLGAGKPSVVVHNNILHLWYTDDTIHPHGLYYLQSTSPSEWNPSESAITNTYDSNSQTIKYNPTSNNFLMLYIDDYLKKYPSLLARVSTDGKNWGSSSSIITAPSLPFYSHSPGLISDKYGHIIQGKQMLGFGACPDLFPSTYCNSIDLYDLYTVNLNSDIFTAQFSSDNPSFLIKNPSFETGLLNNWNYEASQIGFSPTIINTSQHGQFGLELKGNSGTIYQDVSGLIPNKTYNLSAWVKANQNTDSTLHFWLYNLDNNTTLKEGIQLKPNQTWQKFEINFIPPASGTFRLHLSYSKSNNSIIVDNLILKQLTLPGDLNSDGKVNILDYQKLMASFGNPYTIFDYQKIITNYNL